jgi:hypothetical protein
MKIINSNKKSLFIPIITFAIIYLSNILKVNSLKMIIKFNKDKDYKIPMLNSYLELEKSEKEINDYEDDDVIINNKKNFNNVNPNEKPNAYINQNFIEKSFTKMKKRTSSSSLYNNNLNNKALSIDSNKKNNFFRKIQMDKLQERHNLNSADRENINENFNYNKASLGQNHADEFASFLGYLNDASKNASRVISKKENERLSKLLHDTSPINKQEIVLDTD